MMAEPATSDSLVDRPPRDDLFRHIFGSEFDYVYASLRRLGIADRDLADLTHDTFVVVHRKLDLYDTTRPIRPWLFGIAYRVASDHRSLHRHQKELVGVDAQPASTAPLPDELLEEKQERSLVTAALMALPIERRAVFVMHEIEGVPIPEVAEAVGIGLNTAYSRLRLARREFEVAVKRLWLQRGRS